MCGVFFLKSIHTVHSSIYQYPSYNDLWVGPECSKRLLLCLTFCNITGRPVSSMGLNSLTIGIHTEFQHKNNDLWMCPTQTSEYENGKHMNEWHKRKTKVSKGPTSILHHIKAWNKGWAHGAKKVSWITSHGKINIQFSSLFCLIIRIGPAQF